MNEEIKVSYHNDVFFKYMMTREDENSVFIRHSIIESLTGIKPKESVVLNPEINSTIIEGKSIVLDVHLKDEEGREFDIEMQVGGTVKTEMMRFEYYSSTILHDQMPRGGQYSSLKPTFLIVFIDGNIEDNEELIDIYNMRNISGRVEHSNPLITRIYVYLPVVNMIAKKKGILHMTAFEQCCYLFKNDEKDDILNSKESLVKKIMEKHMEMRENKGVWTLAESIEIGKARYDNILQDKYEEGIELGVKEGVKEGFEKGVKKGIEKGIEKEAQELVHKLINQKFHMDASSWLFTLTKTQLDKIVTVIFDVDTFEELKENIK